ncbi:MAG: transcription elongation factor GreAB [Opitutaceae bacterium]
MPPIQKSTLVAAIIDRLREELRVLEDAREMANEEALPDDDIAESQRENRALENQYLVDGQDRVAREHREAILAYQALAPRDFGAGDSAALGALVEVETGSERALYFLGPKAGGLEVTSNGATIFVLTPQSPLGQRLIGRNPGDVFAVANPGPRRTARVLALS